MSVRHELNRRIGLESPSRMSLEFARPGFAGAFRSVPRPGSAHASGECIRPVRVNMSERRARRPTANDPFEYAVPEIPAPEAIAVRKEADPSSNLRRHGPVNQLETDLVGQEGSAP